MSDSFVCVDVEMPLVDYISSLKDNQFFGAGFGLVGVGAFLAVARKGSQYAVSLFQRYGLTTLEITSRDKSYQWLLHWINTQGQHTQHLSVQTSFYQVCSVVLVNILLFNTHTHISLFILTNRQKRSVRYCVSAAVVREVGCLCVMSCLSLSY